MYRYSYELEKFTAAIHILATGEGDVRERLLDAFRGPLVVITAERLPEKLQDDYRWAKEQATKYDEKYPGYNAHFASEDGKFNHLIPGRLESTLHRIKNSTGSKIAQRLFRIWSVLDEDSRQDT